MKCSKREMKKKVIVLIVSCLTFSLYSCIQRTQRIYESDLENMFTSVEKIEEKVGNLVNKGYANEEELLDLKDDVENLRFELENDFFEESEP